MIWGISCYRKVGRGARCIKVGNGPLKLNNFQLIILILLSWSTAGRLSLSKTWHTKIKNFNIKFENHISDYLSSSCFKTHWQSDVIDNTHAFLIIQHALIIFN